jgi:hypothetical protein
VCGVDQQGDAGAAQGGVDGGHRHGLRGGRRELVEHHQPGATGDAGLNGGDHVAVGGVEAYGHLAGHCAGLPAGPLDRHGDGPVPVVGREDLVAAAEADGVEGDADAGGGVRDDGAPVRVEADERGQVAAGGGDSVVEGTTGEEFDRVCFHFVAQPLLGPLDGHRHGTERPVVEVADGGIEAEQQPGTRHRLGRLYHRHT